MAINRYNLIKWTKMIFGKSKLHVNQGLGKNFSNENISGYYNDLREKVLYEKKLNLNEVPVTKIESGENIYFPTAIFQYGLGAYDLFLDTNFDEYLIRFNSSVKWALENQNIDGSWSNFYFSQPEHPFSCMSQGEGASLLIRAYNKTRDSRYLIAAKNSINYMLNYLIQENNEESEEKELILLEYTNKPTVLNGWIFGLFALFDYVIETNDEYYKNILKIGLTTLKKNLMKFDSGYWTFYNIDRTILASRFYHKLHISQLKAIYILTGDKVFKKYYIRWENYDKSAVNKVKAFFVKAIQKIKE